MVVQVRVRGGAKLRRTLKGADVDLSNLTELHRQVGNVILPAARAAAPVGPDAGGHIGPTVRAGATRSAAIIRAGDKRHPYGGPIHFGWPAHGITANPWITAAAQQTEHIWVETYFAGISRIVGKIEGA